jgi:hypothetical protein
LMIGKRLCGLRSLSGINTNSRGQSNQNRQKDKAAWETLVNRMNPHSSYARRNSFF